MYQVTFRDDDVCYYPGVGIDIGVNYLEKFIKTHELMKQYNTTHVIAILASGIDYNLGMVDYIKQHQDLIVPQFHGWTHIDYTQNHQTAEDHFIWGLNRIQATFGKRPTVWYPPWNKSDGFLEELCHRLGLTVSCEKMSTSKFVENPRDGIINFHYWASCDTDYLEDALKIYTKQ